MTRIWIVVALIVISGGAVGAVWWSTQCQRPVLPFPAAPAATRALAESIDPTDSRWIALVDLPTALMQAVVQGLGSYKAMATQVLSQPHVKDGFSKLLLDLMCEAFRGAEV